MSTPSTPSYVITQPSITNLTDGQVVTQNSLLVQSSAFQYTPNDGTDTHTATDWILYSDAALTSMVQESLNDTTNLTSYTFTNLQNNQTYYIQITYHDSNGALAATSIAVSFVVNIPAVVTPPVVTFDGRFSSLPLLVAISGAERIPVLKNNQLMSILSSSLGTTVSGSSGGSVTLLGSLTTYANSVSTFTITNYDVSTAYTVTTSAGTATVNKDTITYTAPAIPGPASLFVNGKEYVLDVLANVVTTPAIIYPAANATVSSSTILITASAFTSTNTSELQQSASWQLASDSAFTNIVATSLNSITNLTSWTVSNLSKSTTYYVRVQYTGQLSGTSAWSTAVQFATGAAFYPQSPVQLLTEIPPASTGFFSESIALTPDGTVAVISDTDTVFGTNSAYGAVFVYSVVGGVYTLTNTLYPGPAQATKSYYFGSTVVISADGLTIAIADAGATITGHGVGYITVYKKIAGVWTFNDAYFNPYSTTTTHNYGNDLAINSDGSKIYVSHSTYISGANVDLGAIDVLTYNTGTGLYSVTDVIHPDYVGSTDFIIGTTITDYPNVAKSISLDPTGLVLSFSGPIPGSGYVTQYNTGTSTWGPLTRLTPLPGNVNASNALMVNQSMVVHCLAMNSTADTIALSYANSLSYGTVAVYKKDPVLGWINHTVFIAATPAVHDQFGASMFLPDSSLNQIYVGSPAKNAAGSVVLYDLSTPTPSFVHSYLPVVSVSQDYFGSLILMNQFQTVLMIGADNDTVSGLTGAGSVSVFK